ncbi:MAG: hypothetical protein OEY87_06685 [Gammaproteobacteria bacterium]|nr:hypothetical protein [Gammaproteobacteria bacterium]MDH5735793.1 hypothetical protein [Gammaproteobacteria bacterium]
MADFIFDHRNQVEDRRSWVAVSRFPVVDCNGIVVREDRRQHAERRGYRLEEINAENIGIKNLVR